MNPVRGPDVEHDDSNRVSTSVIESAASLTDASTYSIFKFHHRASGIHDLQRTVIGSAWEDGEVRVLVLDCIDEPQP